MQCLGWLNRTRPVSMHEGPGKHQDSDLPNLYLNGTENSLSLEMRKNHSQIFFCSNTSWYISVFAFKKPLPTTKTPTLIYAKEMEINQPATFSGKPHSLSAFRTSLFTENPGFTHQEFFPNHSFCSFYNERKKKKTNMGISCSKLHTLWPKIIEINL